MRPCCHVQRGYYAFTLVNSLLTTVIFILPIYISAVSAIWWDKFQFSLSRFNSSSIWLSIKSISMRFTSTNTRGIQKKMDYKLNCVERYRLFNICAWRALNPIWIMPQSPISHPNCLVWLMCTLPTHLKQVDFRYSWKMTKTTMRFLCTNTGHKEATYVNAIEVSIWNGDIPQNI